MFLVACFEGMRKCASFCCWYVRNILERSRCHKRFSSNGYQHHEGKLSKGSFFRSSSSPSLSASSRSAAPPLQATLKLFAAMLVVHLLVLYPWLFKVATNREQLPQRRHQQKYRLEDLQLEELWRKYKSTSDEMCQNPCFHRRNKIIYTYPQTTNSIGNDQFPAFQRMLNLAGHLCATLEVVMPTSDDDIINNSSNKLHHSTQSALTEFWNYTMIGPVVREDPRNPQNMALFEIDEPSIYKHDKYSKYARYYYTKKAKGFSKSFLQVEEYSFQQQSQQQRQKYYGAAGDVSPYFVWIISPNYYDLVCLATYNDNCMMQNRKSFNPLGENQPCNYAVSYAMQLIIDAIFNEMTKKATRYHLKKLRESKINATSDNLSTSPSITSKKITIRYLDLIETSDNDQIGCNLSMNHCSVIYQSSSHLPWQVILYGGHHIGMDAATATLKSRKQIAMGALPNFKKHQLWDADALVWKHMKMAHASGIIQEMHMIPIYHSAIVDTLRCHYSEKRIYLRPKQGDCLECIRTCPDVTNWQVAAHGCCSS